MSIQKSSIPKGTRDLSPIEMNRRKYIFGIIEEVFHHYGYLPIETPAMENLSTLLGKYGEEGDKLIFKILNSGDFLEKVNASGAVLDAKHLTPFISEKALRYDLTVPFARYVVQHRDQIAFPFKRYQLQPVWRADRPQKVRYREFYQCDVDVIGSNSLLNEIEIIQIVDKVFTKLNLSSIIKINNRKILSGIAEVIGEAAKITDITTAIDKMDKIGPHGVNKELESKGISLAAIDKLQPILHLIGNSEEKINVLLQLLASSKTGLQGIAEIRTIFDYLSHLTINTAVEIDLTLARGLNYYTGAIFEVKALGKEMGSICGGGRYDNLTGIFGLPNMSGVGVSFGADRIYDVLLESNLFPADTYTSSKVLLVNFGGKEEIHSLQLLTQIRKVGISAELFPDDVKIGKQFDYANKKNIPYVIVIGAEEMQSNLIALKDMKTGEQQKVNFDELLTILKN